jgi:hypothetical protein
LHLKHATVAPRQCLPGYLKHSHLLTVLKIEILVTGQGLNVRLACMSTTLSRRRVGIFILSTSPQSKVWSRVAFLQLYYPSMTKSSPPEKERVNPFFTRISEKKRKG